MVFTFLLAFVGLTLSGVAIYYSVIGLTAIFAAAFWPIVIMGTTLEVSKLVAASWLKAKWNLIPGFMKTYMTISVFVLMFITSMGIFGFLSKAHIEQTSMSQEQVAQIDTLEEKMARSEAKIKRWQEEIDNLLKGGGSRVDNMAANEQAELDKVYARIKEEKAALQEAADKKIAQQQERIKQAQDRRDTAIAAAEQKFKGSFGGSSAYEKAVEDAKKQELGVASAAQREITKVNSQLDTDVKAVDAKYAGQIKDIRSRISKLKSQATTKTDNIDSRINELEANITKEQPIIDAAREEKFVYEKQYRKLEAEVGPIKYIAEFIYGDQADKNILEKAVTWVIITIIFVFDPLAVLMLLASQMTYAWYKEQKGNEDDTPLPPTIPPTPEPDRTVQSEDSVENMGGDTEVENGTVEPEPEVTKNEDDRREDSKTSEEGTETNSTTQDEEGREQPPETDTVVATVEEPVEDDSKKKDEPQVEEDDWEDYLANASASEKEAMQAWKQRTGGSLKHQRTLHVKGFIKELPWMKDLEPEPDFVDEDALEAAKWAQEQLEKSKVSWMDHDDEGNQIKKEGYKQNEEQDDGSTIWKKIQAKK